MNIITHKGTGRFRASIENEIERLIGLLDDRELYPDLEDDELEPDNDAEYSLGWANDGSQVGLRTDDEAEGDLGWTEHIDQAKASVTELTWHAQDGEPDLGFVGIATGWREREATNDAREFDPADERQFDPADEGQEFLSSPETCGQGVKIGVTPWKERDAAFGPGGMMDGWSWVGDE